MPGVHPVPRQALPGRLSLFVAPTQSSSSWRDPHRAPIAGGGTQSVCDSGQSL